ncbi:uncharacterized protein LOC112879820 isoform X2 [Panicum hallii]|uniref:uncharacterized protein LOC112879820 isoform X2 n=1 Tax=Panicum hallii TaxID=206008 RepID=UPI000DF4EF03|nr:uncharacterized protein LOC112879820 isoform X2 [Panicum hallii]
MGQDCDGPPDCVGEEDEGTGNGMEDVVDNVKNELVEQEESTGSIPSPLFCTTRPNKRLRSKVWDDFIPTFVNGKVVRAECMNCHRTFNYNSTNGTTGLRNHQSKCNPGTRKRPRQHENTPLPSTQKSIAAVSSDPKQKKLSFLLSGQNKCTGTSDEIPMRELAFPDTHTDKNGKKQEVDQNGPHELLAAPELSTDQLKNQIHGENLWPLYGAQYYHLAVRSIEKIQPSIRRGLS